MSGIMGVLLIMWMFSRIPSSFGVHMNLTATVGETVTLPCRVLNSELLVALEWSRPDLKEQYVFLSVDGHTEQQNQHPSFKNRVDLLDRQMKDGDVSLILNNLMINDTGTYKCQVETKTNRRRATLDADPICIIYLRVAPPGPPGHTEDGGIKSTHVFSIVIFSLVVVFVSLGLFF